MITGHNIHENVGRRQQGGTRLILYGTMIDHYDFEDSGKDDTGLEQWVHMVFRGSDGIVTRVVCGYAPCVTSEKACRSTYQQHHIYFMEKESYEMCP